MKNLLTKMLCIVAAFAMTACNKYEECPAISFRSAKARIEGEWDLVSGTIGGKDMFATDLDTFTRQLSCGSVFFQYESKLTKYRWSIKDDGKIIDYEEYFDKYLNETSTIANNCIPVYDSKYENYTNEGKWELEDNNKKLVIKIGYSADDVKFTILELRNKSLQLKGRVDGEEIYLKFEQ